MGIGLKKLLEENNPDVERENLPYDRDDLEPVFSKEVMSFHYDTLHKNYVKKYQEDTGNEFARAGAELHNIFFTQLRPTRANNVPHGRSKALIESKHGSFSEFKEKFKEEALSIKGSGWVYMDRSGDIKIIKNHQLRTGVSLLLDMWEHAYIIDYGADKSRYVDMFFRIINWDIVNERLT